MYYLRSGDKHPNFNAELGKIGRKGFELYDACVFWDVHGKAGTCTWIHDGNLELVMERLRNRVHGRDIVIFQAVHYGDGKGCEEEDSVIHKGIEFVVASSSWLGKGLCHVRVELINLRDDGWRVVSIVESIDWHFSKEINPSISPGAVWLPRLSCQERLACIVPSLPATFIADILRLRQNRPFRLVPSVPSPSSHFSLLSAFSLGRT